MNPPSNRPIAARTRDDLVTEIRNGASPKWLFFWGHKPAPDGSVSKSCFSQWWEGHPFTVSDVAYSTAEHFMMAEKARLFGDADTLAEILDSKGSAMAKKLGRKVLNFDEERWRTARWDIVVRGNEAKFGQHTAMKNFLLQTGERVLVEASPYDSIWGIGMGANHPAIENPLEWKGLNLLGFALMEVRERLRREELR